MTLTVLGGSAAGVNTGAGCAGYLIDSALAQFVLDLGPGTLQELRKHADFRRLAGIAISHLHLDHVLDLAALRFALAYNPDPPPSKVPLWMPPDGDAFLRRFAWVFAEASKQAEFFHDYFEVKEYDPSTSVPIGDAVIEFTPTVHYVPCWAMRLAIPGSSGDLFYTADTGPAANLVSRAKGCAVVVAESTLLEASPEPYEARGHLTAREAGALARDAGARTLVLTHMWEELDFAAYRHEAEQVFDGRIVLAQPGVTIEW
ncbi:MAG: MBL fold metallo-hydrolase [Thermomicrobiales bacterium]